MFDHWGVQQEKNILELVNNKLGRDYKKISNNFHPYDFQEDNNFIELKSRRCKYNAYPTTMIGKNKVIYALKRPNCSFKFLFNFTDGLYYWDLDTTKDYTFSKGGRKDRGSYEEKDYLFIPISELKLF